LSKEDRLIKRFVGKIEKLDGCWLWVGLKGPNGYGRFSVGTREISAHRFSYQHFIGAIAPGMTVDHICRIKICVRPDHLQLLTNEENSARAQEFVVETANAKKKYCKRGHELSGFKVLLLGSENPPALAGPLILSV
jgi:hypothetical protein